MYNESDECSGSEESERCYNDSTDHSDTQRLWARLTSLPEAHCAPDPEPQMVLSTMCVVINGMSTVRVLCTVRATSAVEMSTVRGVAMTGHSDTLRDCEQTGGWAQREHNVSKQPRDVPLVSRIGRSGARIGRPPQPHPSNRVKPAASSASKRTSLSPDADNHALCTRQILTTSWATLSN